MQNPETWAETIARLIADPSALAPAIDAGLVEHIEITTPPAPAIDKRDLIGASYTDTLEAFEFEMQPCCNNATDDESDPSAFVSIAQQWEYA